MENAWSNIIASKIVSLFQSSFQYQIAAMILQSGASAYRFYGNYTFLRERGKPGMIIKIFAVTNMKDEMDSIATVKVLIGLNLEVTLNLSKALTNGTPVAISYKSDNPGNYQGELFKPEVAFISRLNELLDKNTQNTLKFLAGLSLCSENEGVNP